MRKVGKSSSNGEQADWPIDIKKKINLGLLNPRYVG